MFYMVHFVTVLWVLSGERGSFMDKEGEFGVGVLEYIGNGV